MRSASRIRVVISGNTSRTQGSCAEAPRAPDSVTQTTRRTWSDNSGMISRL